MSPQASRQRGIALLVALLVVALAAVIIAGLLDRGELAAARVRNQLRAGQARAYADGLEAYAAKVLRQDEESGNGIDTSDDVWAIPLPPTQVPGGEITATMTDLNGRFNLNNLDPANPTHVEWQKKFGQLLIALGLDPALSDDVTAWMNADPSNAAANADDAYYLAQEVPYRAARREFMHVSELRLVKGVNGRVYTRLAPYVSALPAGTRININTASVPVLMTLPNVTREMAQSIWQQGHAQFKDFSQLIQAAPQIGAIQCAACYGFTSSYFRARGDITLDGLPFTFYSVIERRQGSHGGIRVIRRSRGGDD